MQGYDEDFDPLEMFRSPTELQKFLSYAWNLEVQTQGLGSFVDFEVLTRPFDLAGAYDYARKRTTSEIKDHLRNHIFIDNFYYHLEAIIDLLKSSQTPTSKIEVNLQYDTIFKSTGALGGFHRCECKLYDREYSLDKWRAILKSASSQIESLFSKGSEFSESDRAWRSFDAAYELYLLINYCKDENLKDDSLKLVGELVKSVIDCSPEYLTTSYKLKILGSCYALLIQQEKSELINSSINAITNYFTDTLKDPDTETKLDYAISILEGISDFFEFSGKNFISNELNALVKNIDQILFKDHRDPGEKIKLDDKPIENNLPEDVLMELQFTNWGLNQKKSWCLSLTYRLTGEPQKEVDALQQCILASKELAAIGLGVGNQEIYERAMSHLFPENQETTGVDLELDKIPELAHKSITHSDNFLSCLKASAYLMGRFGRSYIPIKMLEMISSESLSVIFRSFAHGVCERHNPKISFLRWAGQDI